MASKYKEESLLEIAIELLQQKQKPQKINNIIKEVMELKGLKASLSKELAPQFVLDFMQSGYFVYCGDECWDLKDRQSTDVLDKEGGDYVDIHEDDEDVKKGELTGDVYLDEQIQVVEEDDDDDDDEEEEDDIAKEIEEFGEDVDLGFSLVNEDEINEE